jgi:hypothetical protein
MEQQLASAVDEHGLTIEPIWIDVVMAVARL